MLALVTTVSLIIGFALGLSWVDLLLQRKMAEREKKREIEREIEQRIRERIAAIGEKQDPAPELHLTPPAPPLPPMRAASHTS